MITINVSSSSPCSPRASCISATVKETWGWEGADGITPRRCFHQQRLWEKCHWNHSLPDSDG